MRTLTNLITKVLIILISTIGVVSCGDSPEELSQKGLDYYKVGNYTEAIKYFKLSAEQGHAFAQYGLGAMYGDGLGVEQNYHEAEKWLRLAAEQGIAEAQETLARVYMTGLGVEQNYYEAAKWAKLAAEQGIAESQAILGALYSQGWGVEQNDYEAEKWFNLAAAQGYEPVIKLLNNSED